MSWHLHLSKQETLAVDSGRLHTHDLDTMQRVPAACRNIVQHTLLLEAIGVYWYLWTIIGFKYQNVYCLNLRAANFIVNQNHI